MVKKIKTARQKAQEAAARKARRQAKKVPTGRHIPKKPVYCTEDEVRTALRANDGFVYAAAEALGVCYETMRGYMHRWPDLQKEVRHAKRRAAERAAKKLMELVDRGEWQAIRFMLLTWGKPLGFVIHKNFSVNQKGAVPVLPEGVGEGVVLTRTKVTEIVNAIRVKQGLAPVRGDGLGEAIKQLPDAAPGADNKGVVIDNGGTTDETTTGT